MLKFITLLLTSSMTVMAGATIAPALPQIQLFFQAESNSIFWVKLLLTLPALFTAISAPFAGIIIDRFGRKKLLAMAVFLYGIAGGSGYLLKSLIGLLIGRAFLGLSVAAIMTASIALVADYYQGPKRNRIMGIQAAFMGLGGVIFLTLGGFLADLSWRMPFLVYCSAFAILPLVIFTLTEPQTALVHSPLTLERDEDKKMPVRTIILIYFLTFLTMVVFYLIPVQLPFYLIEQFQVKNTQSGLAIAALNLTSSIASIGYGNIKARLTFPAILVLLYSLMGVGYILMSLAGSYQAVILSLIVAGAGLGLLLPNMNVWLNAITPISVRGKMLGGLTTCMFLGQFSSPILSQPLTQNLGSGITYGIVGISLLLLAVVVLAGSFFYQPNSSEK